MTPEQAFKNYLEKNSLRMTSQRELILSIFLKEEGHFNAEEFYGIVKKKDSAIGQATVYRNLRHFVKSGLARELDFGNGALYYEHKFGHDHHDHIICTECGKRAEVYDSRIERLQRKLAEENGYKLTGHKLYLYGLCPECHQ